MILETSRLFLREMREEDFNALYAILADSDVTQHYPYTFDDSRVRNWITRNITRYRTDGFGLWAVIRKDTGEMIGDCGLTLQNIRGRTLPEIGYHIRKDHWKMGYGSEAAAACINWTFAHTEFPAVYSYMKYTNTASRRTAMKCGMEFVEEYPDPDNTVTTVYTISREKWINR